jgi:hypothetical protein
MRAAVKPRCGVLFLMVLTLGVSLGLPAEDVLDTDHDDSETLPYEVLPLILIVVPLADARTTRVVLSSLYPKHGAPSLCAAARVRDADVHQSADARVSLALLCTLLC